jgi:hypothetical protein
MISGSELSVNYILVEGKYTDRLPFEIILDNKYYKTKLILDKNCKSPSLVLYCTKEMIPSQTYSTETVAVIDFSGDLQSKCFDLELDWIDGSGDDWMDDLKQYLECFPWPVINRHGDGKSAYKPLPLGLLDAEFNSDEGDYNEGGCEKDGDDDDPFDFEKTLREFQDIKGNSYLTP